MRVADLVALDVHVHVEVSAGGHNSLPPHLMSGSAAYFKVAGEERTRTVPEIAAYYRERRMAAVVFTVDAEAATGHPPISSEEIAEECAEHADVLVPFASVDPWRGRAAVRRAVALVERYGVRGFKFHPSLGAFHPNDRMLYPLYDVLQDSGMVALFHTGQTGIGAGLPGGGGIRLKYSDPMAVDDVAADFPDLRIVLAHPSFPWQDAALAIATHKPLVHIDLSGWSPKYFPPQLVRYANTLLREKVLFGSDFPVITPDRWLADFAKLDVRPEVVPMILKENAVRLLGLGDA
ncbi:amidohydrolase family protein [Actinophytocola xanthii]|uniref:4-hydroxyphenyl-beta-ketoacyl-CoA hydrolase n=1 Tax=Actinophytocola xanthii TaxID=1912961 RepID=A0A1Q8CW10_9PSEU|nr:amidohydrolase family protein [Actinophytocola xanthii]OLF18544.1 4-hydroxyphenyl-beta-ketoacyl-CoA hydrolase [Actinophytocola xanthii]